MYNEIVISSFSILKQYFNDKKMSDVVWWTTTDQEQIFGQQEIDGLASQRMSQEADIQAFKPCSSSSAQVDDSLGFLPWSPDPCFYGPVNYQDNPVEPQSSLWFCQQAENQASQSLSTSFAQDKDSVRSWPSSPAEPRTYTPLVQPVQCTTVAEGWEVQGQCDYGNVNFQNNSVSPQSNTSWNEHMGLTGGQVPSSDIPSEFDSEFFAVFGMKDLLQMPEETNKVPLNLPQPAEQLKGVSADLPADPSRAADVVPKPKRGKRRGSGRKGGRVRECPGNHPPATEIRCAKRCNLPDWLAINLEDESANMGSYLSWVDRKKGLFRIECPDCISELWVKCSKEKRKKVATSPGKVKTKTKPKIRMRGNEYVVFLSFCDGAIVAVASILCNRRIVQFSSAGQ